MNVGRMVAAAYRSFGYLGVFSVLGSMLAGFAHDPEAPAIHYLYNVALYAAWVTPHLVMTRGWYKRAVWGDPGGGLAERRTYVVVAIATWFLVLCVYWPTPGPAYPLPREATLLGAIGFLYFAVKSFEGSSFEAIDGLLAVPGAQARFSHGPETPLLTEGAYGEVRHPMYRAALLAGLCSLMLHPNLSQAFWGALIGGTLIGFLPFEEAQLLAARREDYERYRQQVPYRLFRGVW